MLRTTLLPSTASRQQLDTALAMSNLNEATHELLASTNYDEYILYVLVKRLHSHHAFRTFFSTLFASLPQGTFSSDNSTWNPLFDELSSAGIPLSIPDISLFTVTEETFTLKAPLFLHALYTHPSLSDALLRGAYHRALLDIPSPQLDQWQDFANSYSHIIPLVEEAVDVLHSYLTLTARSSLHRQATPPPEPAPFLLALLALRPDLWPASLRALIHNSLFRGARVIASYLALADPTTPPNMVALAAARIGLTNRFMPEVLTMRAIILHPNATDVLIKDTITRHQHNTPWLDILQSLPSGKIASIAPLLPQSLQRLFFKEVTLDFATITAIYPSLSWHIRLELVARFPQYTQFQDELLCASDYSGDLVKACLSVATGPQRQSDILMATLKRNPSEVSWLLKGWPLLPGAVTSEHLAKLLANTSLPPQALPVIRHRVLEYMGRTGQPHQARTL